METVGAHEILDSIWEKERLDVVLKCPECGECSKVSEFGEGVIDVECSCGTHFAIMCPKCNGVFDTIIGDEEFEIVI